MKTFPTISLRHDTIHHDSQLWKEAEHSNNARHANQTHPRCVWLVVTVAIPSESPKSRRICITKIELNFINDSLILHLACDCFANAIQSKWLYKPLRIWIWNSNTIASHVWTDNTNDLGLNKITARLCLDMRLAQKCLRNYVQTELLPDFCWRNSSMNGIYIYTYYWQILAVSGSEAH